MMTFRARLKEARKTNQPRLRFDLEKLRDPVAYTFQATMGGKFASLIGLRDEELDIDTMITTYNTAVTDLKPVRYLGKNVAGSRWSPEMFSTSMMRGEI